MAKNFKSGKGYADAESKNRLGSLDRRLFTCAGCHRANLSRSVRGLQSATVRARWISAPSSSARTKWRPPNGKANFTTPKSAFAVPLEGDGVYELMTMRADGQFNTTIYNEDDRFRGIQGGRYVVFMNPLDMDVEGLKQGDTATLSTAAGDGVERTLTELQVVAYDIPRKSIAGFYPECNGLISLWHYAEGSKVPAAKSVPVRIFKDVVPEITEDSEGQISTI